MSICLFVCVQDNSKVSWISIRPGVLVEVTNVWLPLGPGKGFPRKLEDLT